MSRILFTVINDLTYDQRMQRICTSLADGGYDVLLIGRKIKSSIPLEERNFQQKRFLLFFTKGKLFYLEYNIRLFFFLLFQKFDVACGIDLDTILPCYLISRLKGKKCMYDAHELFPEVPEVAYRPITKKMWLWLEKFSVKRIKNCYTVSSGLADYFEKNYGRKFEVIRNVPVLDKTQNESTDEIGMNEQPHQSHKGVMDMPSSLNEKFIFYQGALNEGRGLEQMISAMKEIPLRLKLAGEGDLSQQLRKLVSEKNLDDRVEFLGRKKPEELKSLTQQSFIGLNLLENRGLSYYYSLANKFFDYVHAGVPVITMNFPEYKNLNQEFEVALLIDQPDPLTIVNAINRLTGDKDYYFCLRENCIRARAEWNWQKEEVKLLSFYQHLQ